MVAGRHSWDFPASSMWLLARLAHNTAQPTMPSGPCLGEWSSHARIQCSCEHLKPSVCRGLAEPQGLLNWHGVWAWLDFHKGGIRDGLIQNDSFQSPIISFHCSSSILCQHAWQQGSIYVAAVSVWGGLITAVSLINSNWKQLTLRRTKPIRDQLTKEDECALRASVWGGGHVFRRLAIFSTKSYCFSSFRENVFSFCTICVLTHFYQLIASSLLICMLLLISINDTNSVCYSSTD